jgi:hypothetical protein
VAAEVSRTVERIMRLLEQSEPVEYDKVRDFVTGRANVYATSTRKGIGQLLVTLTEPEKAELLDRIGRDDGPAGVREPRRPRPPRGSAGAVVVPERESEPTVAVAERDG